MLALIATDGVTLKLFKTIVGRSSRRQLSQNPVLRRPLAHRTLRLRIRLCLAGLDDGGGALVLDRARVAAALLDGADNALGLNVVIGNLAEDDVLAVQPRGDDGGDEELDRKSVV